VGGDEPDGAIAADECSESEEFVFGLVEPLTAPSGVLAEAFAEGVLESSDGRLTVDIVPASQLGAPLEQIEALRGGSQALLAFDKGFNAEYVDDYAALEVPFLIESDAALLDVLASDLGERLRGELAAAGLVTLSDRYLVAPRVVFTAERAEAIDEFRGMRFRVPEIEVYFETWSAIGISPTPIAWGEIYLSLQQGVIDGGEGPLVAVESNSFTEVAPYMMETNHLRSVNNILMSAQVFEGLCAEDQQALLRVASEIEDSNNDRLEEDVSERRDKPAWRRG
jgi:TRAP-type C4-dicarboxylate transport system substrate-binding protein